MVIAPAAQNPELPAERNTDVASQQAVIGSLVTGAAWSDVADLVFIDDYIAAHRPILQAVASLAAEGKPLDVFTVAGQLEAAQHLKVVGGIAYLSQLARTTPTAVNARAYALAVREQAIKRQLPEKHRDAEGVAQLRRALGELDALKAPPVATAFQVVWFAMMHTAVHREALIKGLLLVNSLVVIYGEPGSGKSFLAMDMALAVAAGKPWRGRKTKKGLVVYVAGEGAVSVQLRVAAYRKAHPEIPAGIPFCVLPQAVDFLDPESVERLIGTIRGLESEAGERTVQVIIDTLSRAMNGNENAPEIMGAAIDSAEHIRASCTDAAVVFIHHAGKDPTKGARGHSKLNAAIDTEIFVEGKSGVRVATVQKQRDIQIGDKFAFELRQVVLDTDADGDPITSCVVDETATPLPPAITRIKGANKGVLFTALKEWQRTHPDRSLISSIELTDIAKSQKLTGSRKREAVAGLEQDGVLHPAVGGHRLSLERFTA